MKNLENRCEHLTEIGVIPPPFSICSLAPVIIECPKTAENYLECPIREAYQMRQIYNHK